MLTTLKIIKKTGFKLSSKFFENVSLNNLTKYDDLEMEQYHNTKTLQSCQTVPC